MYDKLLKPRQPFWITLYIVCQSRLQNCEKRLSASSHPSVCPSVRMERLGSHRADFHEIWYFKIFRKSIDEIQVVLKSDDDNNRYWTWRPVNMTTCEHEDLWTFMIISRWFLLRMRSVSVKIVGKIKTHISFAIPTSRKSCRLRDNGEKSGTAGQATDDNIMRRRRDAVFLQDN